MPVFNRAVRIISPPPAVVDAIRRTVSPDQQIVMPRPDRLIVVLRGEWGYLYVLQPQDDASTEVRLIVDSAQAIRSAFRGRSPKEALMELLNTPSMGDDRAASAADEHLKLLQQRLEGAAPEPEILPPLPVSSTAAPSSSLKPWNPDSFAFLYLFNTIFVGIAFAINWWRLGKRGWALPTAALSLLLPGVAFPILLIKTSGDMARLLQIGVLLLALGAGWGMTLGLGSLQRGAYKHWLQGGSLRTYDYDFDRAALITGLTTLGFVVVVGGFIYLTSRPGVYENADLKVTYDSMWASQDIAQVPGCENAAVYECLLAVTDEQFGFTWILIARYPASTGATVELVSANMENMLATRGGQVISWGSTQLGGIPAAQIFYTIPVEGDLHYGTQIYLNHNGVTYEIIAESQNEGIFHEREAQINELIQGIVFK